MSQPAATQDPFVPFDPVPASGARTSGAFGGLKVVPLADSPPRSALAEQGAGLDFTPLATSAFAHTHAASMGTGKPVVTLQRDGERVAGIRIECVCGQIIELACSY